MIKELKPEPQQTTFSVIKSTFGEFTAILFLLMLNNIFTKFALGILGDDTYTSYKDESLDDYLSPFFQYSELFNNIGLLINNILAGVLIIWIIMAVLNKFFKNDSESVLNGDSISEKFLFYTFRARVSLALFTLIYFILCLIFYFAYTAHFLK